MMIAKFTTHTYTKYDYGRDLGVEKKLKEIIRTYTCILYNVSTT